MSDVSSVLSIYDGPALPSVGVGKYISRQLCPVCGHQSSVYSTPVPATAFTRMTLPGPSYCPSHSLHTTDIILFQIESEYDQSWGVALVGRSL